jgi:hypothetical protein
MMIVSVNPDTASPSGTPNPILATTLVVVVVGDRRVVDVVDSPDLVTVVVDSATSAGSGSPGAGARQIQPMMNAATTAPIPASRLQRP